jgi:hypothetical protein
MSDVVQGPCGEGQHLRRRRSPARWLVPLVFGLLGFLVQLARSAPDKARSSGEKFGAASAEAVNAGLFGLVMVMLVEKRSPLQRFLLCVIAFIMTAAWLSSCDVKPGR